MFHVADLRLKTADLGLHAITLALELADACALLGDDLGQLDDLGGRRCVFWVDQAGLALTPCSAVIPSALYDLIWNGEVKPVRIGHSARFAVTEIERFVAARSRAES